jgi:hypothetical protein
MDRRKEDIDGWMYKSHGDDHLQGERCCGVQIPQEQTADLCLGSSGTCRMDSRVSLDTQ